MKNNTSFSSCATRYTLHATRGFTFLELMITIGISFILLTVGAVSLVGFRNQQNLENEARSLVAVITGARNRALQEDTGSRWGVWVQNEISTRPFYALFQVDEALIASSSYLSTPGTVIDRKSLRSGLSFITPAAGATTSIVFSKLTGAPNASASILIQIEGDEASQKTITVNTSGRIDYQ